MRRMSEFNKKRMAQGKALAYQRFVERGKTPWKEYKEEEELFEAYLRQRETGIKDWEDYKKGTPKDE